MVLQGVFKCQHAIIVKCTILLLLLFWVCVWGGGGAHDKLTFWKDNLISSSFFLKSQAWKILGDLEVEGQVNWLPWPAGGEGREKWESGSGVDI